MTDNIINTYPNVSIITVTFNSGATLKDTIASVIKQTYSNIEYIIIDGASKDNTIEVIKRYAASYPINWISEPDQGIYDAMNKGIKMATGDYVGILNADDTFYENQTIEKVVDFLRSDSMDACIGNVVQHRKDGKIIRTYSSKNWTPEKLKIGFMPPHPSIFFKRELFKRYGDYALGYAIASDYELIIRYFLKNKISYGYSGIITTRMSIGGVSSSGFSSYKKITSEVDKAFQDNNIPHSHFKVKYRIVWKIMGYIKGLLKI